jgi:hypothetical protein
MSETLNHPLRESIARHNIRRVAVVDDAFDPVSLASFQEGEDREFLAAVNEQDALLKEFHKLVHGQENDDVINESHLTDEVAKLLWDHGRTLEGLGLVLRRTLFRVLELKVSQVERLCDFLKDQLQIESVETYGTAADLPGGEFGLAFVDYRFGPSRQDESVRRAVRWAKHLYHNGKTFIILMSAESEAIKRQEPFRRDSELTRGLFEFLEKKEIDDPGKFCNRLNSFCAGLDTRHEVHRFASAVETAADQAITALKESIHALGLEDYAYLEQISLREDGHPLGDYMVWLLGEYFAHNLAVNDSLQPARKEVNGLKFDRFLPLQRPPSVMLARMYSAAITDPVHEGWDPHPREVQEEGETGTGELHPAANATPMEETTGERPAPTERVLLSPSEKIEPSPELSSERSAPAEGITGVVLLQAPQSSAAPAGEAAPSAKGMPLYQLGDLLIADQTKPAFLILNAGCDLQFSPGKRECDPQQTILLVPGRFEPLHERSDETNVKRTELFELGEERFRIIWQHTRTIALPYYQVRPAHEPKGYHRRWRLKVAYALEVQQHFASQLTRVGVPTPTPVFRERSVEVYGKDAEGNYRNLGTIRDGIVVFHHRDRDQFVLTVDCVHAVLDHIDGYVAEIEGELNSRKVPPVTPDLPVKSPGEKTALAEAATNAPKDAPRVSPKGEKKEIVRDPEKEADKRAERRQKYVNELRRLREFLARSCAFQDNLSDLPPLDGSSPQTETVLKGANPSPVVRLEIMRTARLSGQFKSGAPIVLAFSLPDTPPAGQASRRDMPEPEPENQALETHTKEASPL